MNKTTERLKSALYLRLKKRKVFKIVKGALDFLKIQFVAKYQKTEGGLFHAILKKSRTVQEKIRRGDHSVLSVFANARKSFWLTQGLEPVTAGFPVNRLKSVLKSGTCRVPSVV